MTRRGSIAYYLAAVVCGSFFLAATYYAYFLAKGAGSQRWGRDFLFVYFFTIAFGFLPQLLGAWVLRRLALRLAWKGVLPWLLAGTAIWVALVWCVVQLGTAVEAWRPSPAWMQVRATLLVSLIGAMYAGLQPLWIPIPAAAATGWVLYSVHRAFAERT